MFSVWILVVFGIVGIRSVCPGWIRWRRVLCGMVVSISVFYSSFYFIIEVMVVGCRSCGDERCCDCKINKYLYEYCNDLKLA